MMVLKYLKIAPVVQIPVLFSLSNPQYKEGIKKKKKKLILNLLKQGINSNYRSKSKFF